VPRGATIAGLASGPQQPEPSISMIMKGFTRENGVKVFVIMKAGQVTRDCHSSRVNAIIFLCRRNAGSRLAG
jgi:hypothetical protein